MGAPGPLTRLRGAVVRRTSLGAAWLTLVALATMGCRPATAEPSTPAALARGSESAGSPPLSAQLGPEAPAADDDEDLSGSNDDFAALAYALHGLDEHGQPAREDDDPDLDDHDHDHEADDQTPSTWNLQATPARSPLSDLSPEEIKRRLKEDPASLGSISIGATNRGALFNGVQVPAGEHWSLTDPGSAYGTAEAVEQLIAAIEAVNEKYPKTQKMIIGHFSARRGGRLKPHRSHQAGRDVDVSYYFTDTKSWYSTATAQNLDRARTWAFVKALLTKADVEMIFMDTSVQKLLRDHALAAGEDRQFVDRVFQVSGQKQAFAPIRHAPGHATHIHVRFRSPIAVASGQVAAAYLPRPKDPTRERGTAKHNSAVAQKDAPHSSDSTAKSKPARNAPLPKEDAPSFVMHRCRSGDTLDALARRYGTTPDAIREANGLKGNALKEKRTYRIPVARREGARPGSPAKRKG